MKDFFISYNQADRAWAEWIAWTLEEAGYSVIIQAWDFRPGGNFVLDMQRAIEDTNTTIAVLSADYLTAEYTHPEWAVAFRQDPQGQHCTLIPIRVSDCQPTGLLGIITYADLVDCPGPEAHRMLLDAVKARVKPEHKPPVPVRHADRIVPERVTFPGMLWTVPYERNVFFTGRDQVLADLRQRLTQDSAAALSQTQAISGLGGIGKTQTAVEYAYRYRQKCGAVFWVRSETETELTTGFVEIARRLDLPQKEAQDPNDTVAAVKRWLEQHSDWLLIFDNADNPTLLKPFCPQASPGHILLTSRAQVFGVLGIAQPMALEQMQPQEALEFLCKRTGRDSTDQLEQETATHLAAELGYLPLALEQAGAYIQEQQARFQTYLASYRKRHLSLLEQSSPVASDYPASVATTWSLNVQQVEAASAAAADVLRASAFFSPDDIPYELLWQGADQLGERIATTLVNQEDDPIVLNELLAPLARYSMIRLAPESQSYSIYRLVQEVVKDNLDADSHRLWAERTVRAVTQVFPNVEYGNWDRCDRLLPHAQVAVKVVKQLNFEFEAAALLLTRTGDYLNERGRYSEAEPMLVHALELRKRLLGEEHLDVAQSLNNLAVLYHDQGRYSEAEPMHVQALELKKRLLGEKHPSVTLSLHNLAALYDSQGRYSEAEPMYIQALELRKYLLGEEHPYIASNLNDLAVLYYNQGCYGEAEHILIDAVSLWRKFLGNEHPNLAIGLNNLARCYRERQNYSQAEQLCQEALEIAEKSLPDDHELRGRFLDNFAMLRVAQGQHAAARSIVQQALAILEPKLGADHPWTVRCRENLNMLGNPAPQKDTHDQAPPIVRSLLTVYCLMTQVEEIVSGCITIHEIDQHMTVSLSDIHRSILTFLQNRQDLVFVLEAYAVNAYLQPADVRMTADVDIQAIQGQALASDIIQHLHQEFYIAARVREIGDGRAWRIYQRLKSGNRHLVDIRQVDTLPSFEVINRIQILSPLVSDQI